MLNKLRKRYVWCLKYPEQIGVDFFKPKRNIVSGKERCSYRKSKFPRKIKCPYCKKKFTLKLQECTDTSLNNRCIHAYIPAHKKAVKI